MLYVKNDKLAVKLSRKGGGCAGFKYQWDFINDDQITKDDEIIEVENGKFVVGGEGLLFLTGTKVDYAFKRLSSFQPIPVTSICGWWRIICSLRIVDMMEHFDKLDKEISDKIGKLNKRISTLKEQILHTHFTQLRMMKAS